MKLISFIRKGMPRWGVVTDSGVLDMILPKFWTTN